MSDKPNAEVGEMNESTRAAAARSTTSALCTPRRAAGTGAGGPTGSTSRSSPRTPPWPTRTARTSTTPRRSTRLDLDEVKRDIDGRADDLAGLVAGRLRPLRPAHDPHGVAQRRHVPHHRRARRRRGRPAALRADQQLAGQRQPRQGPPAAVAGQAEVRPGALVGGPDGPHRQRRAGVDGLRDVRLRRRPRGRLGARRGRLLGPRDHVAGRRALQRRPRPREALRRRPDGPHLRQPGGPERQAGLHGRGQGHPRDVQPHGDERRGDGRADRRRPLVRQDPRRGRPGRVRRPRARGRPARGAGPRLAATATAAARARTRSPAGSRSPGPPRRPGGATTSSRTCTATSGS